MKEEIVEFRAGTRCSLRWGLGLALLLLPASRAAAGDREELRSSPPDVHDPGPRGGAPGAGGPLPHLADDELKLFNEGLFRATELEATCDSCSDVPPGTAIPPGSPPDTTNSAGLGGRFNSDQCVACHSHPALGGTSPATNPSFAIAGHKGATNVVPFFESLHGPTREVRFRFNEDGTRDGSVHQKFTVKGRSDAPLCQLEQPDFRAAEEKYGLAFRIPTPLFGLGLVDSIPDIEIRAHLNSHPERKARLGIHGTPNLVGNNSTIGRFGWKAQNASITVFAGEAYNVEMGITNELFPISKTEDETCNLGAEPNDVTRVDDAKFDDPREIMADWLMFSLFTRFLDAPQPVALGRSAERGFHLFEEVGCSECHVPSMKTRPAPLGPLSKALAGKTVNLFSDLVVHHMGANLADNIIQGAAGPDEFRTTPLWGVSQRIFFLHDGRTSDLLEAILEHFSPASPPNPRHHDPAYPASEANGVIRNFNELSVRDKQAILDFLRSL